MVDEPAADHARLQPEVQPRRHDRVVEAGHHDDVVAVRVVRAAPAPQVLAQRQRRTARTWRPRTPAGAAGTPAARESPEALDRAERVQQSAHRLGQRLGPALLSAGQGQLAARLFQAGPGIGPDLPQAVACQRVDADGHGGHSLPREVRPAATGRLSNHHLSPALSGQGHRRVVPLRLDGGKPIVLLPGRRRLCRVLLRFPPEPGVNGQVAAAARVSCSGPPPVHLHHPGFDEVQAREEPADLGVRSRRNRDSGLLVVPLHAVGHLIGGRRRPRFARWPGNYPASRHPSAGQ